MYWCGVMWLLLRTRSVVQCMSRYLLITGLPKPQISLPRYAKSLLQERAALEQQHVAGYLSGASAGGSEDRRGALLRNMQAFVASRSQV